MAQLGDAAEALDLGLLDGELRRDGVLGEGVAFLLDGVARGELLGGDLGEAEVEFGDEAVLVELGSRITGFFSTALGLLTDLVVIAFVGLYISVAPDLYRRGLLALVPPRGEGRAKSVLSNLDNTLWWWLIAKLIAMAIVGVLTGLGLWWLGIPAPVALGALAALLTFIPNFGPVLAAAPALLLAMTQGLKDAGFVALLYVAIQTIESYLITPNIEKKTINLPPALTISVQVLLGILAGGLGLLVATPLCATALVLVRTLYVQRAPDEAPSR